MKIGDKDHRRARLIELVAYRKKHQGMKQAEFARLADMEPSYLSRLLSDPSKKQHRAIDLQPMTKIIQGHNLSPNWFNMPMGSELEPAEDRDEALAKVYGLSPMAITMAGYFNARVPHDDTAQVEAFQAAQEAIIAWLEKRSAAQSDALARLPSPEKLLALPHARTYTSRKPG